MTGTEFNKNVGLRVKRLRRIEGLTQEEFAHIMAYSRASITSIEAGRQALSLWAAHRMCDLFDTDLSWLCASEGKPRQPNPQASWWEIRAIGREKKSLEREVKQLKRVLARVRRVVNS